MGRMRIAMKALKSLRMNALYLLLLATINPALTAYSWGHPSRGSWSDPDAEDKPPEFVPTDTSITALAGQTVYLPCRVANLGDKVVSWIRTHDLHILTSHVFTYTSDGRFEVLHKPDSDVWSLRIMGVRVKDEGTYECQINTDPKMKRPVTLHIRESDMRDSPYDFSHDRPPPVPNLVGGRLAQPIPNAKVLGPAEQYVHLGSTVTFTCLVEAPYAFGRRPKTVNWFHSGRLVTFQAERGGISMDTEKTDEQTSSKLTVAVVTSNDAGNYTCRPSDARPATVTLIVMEGEHTEAMQRDASGGQKSITASCYHLTTFLCLLYRCWTYHLLQLDTT